MSSTRCVPVFLMMLVTVLILPLSACEQQARPHTFTFATMGTQASCKLMLPPDLTAKDAETIVRESFSQVNTSLSTWLPNSEISKLNRAPADSAVALSPLLHTCLLVSRELQKKSSGAFDPTAESLMRLWGFYRRQGVLPSTAALDSALADLGCWHLAEHSVHIIKEKADTRFDLGGIAKGLAVDVAVARLREAGLDAGLIDLGGNLFCLGGAPGREDWRVGIRNPHNRNELFATINISDVSVATSGSYERFITIDGRRYGHIMNPATGRPAEGMLSATVIASTGILADGISTTLFVLGPDEALSFLEQYYPQVEAVLVFSGPAGGKDMVMATRGLTKHIALLPGFDEQYQIVSNVDMCVPPGGLEKSIPRPATEKR